MLSSGRYLNNRRALFGDVAIVVFLICQVLDGAFTYIGVQQYGRAIEANPLLSWLMATMGDGAALATAKAVATVLGGFLHLAAVHTIVAALTGLYLAAAVLPWVHLLFLMS